MLIHPWDAALDEAEWSTWLADGHDFGQLAVNGAPGHAPMLVPTHFVRDGACLLVHLARPNPIWALLADDARLLMSVVDDYAFVPSGWRQRADRGDEDGVPTSYYAVVQFGCRAEIVDEPAAKAELLTRQLAHFQPDGDHGALDGATYRRLLPGIRGLRLHIESVRAKFKYDDNRPETQQDAVARRLVERHRGRDAAAAGQQQRRRGQR